MILILMLAREETNSPERITADCGTSHIVLIVFQICTMESYYNEVPITTGKNSKCVVHSNKALNIINYQTMLHLTYSCLIKFQVIMD